MRVCELIAARSLVALIVSLAVVLPLSAQEQGVSAAMQQAFVTASHAAEAGQSLPTGTAEYRVGQGCAYSSIQDAIDAISNHGSGVIRIESGFYTENLSISNKSIDLLGGHADCVSTNPSGITTIDASSASLPAIYLFVLGGPAGNSHQLHISRLNLSNGTGGSALTPGGGLTVVTADDRSAVVTMRSTKVFGNQSLYRGGGIALLGGGSGSLTLLDNPLIMLNTVTGDDPYGGGLYCQGDYSVMMFGGSIYSNVAGQSPDDNARGGGIYLDGCDMTWAAQNQTEVLDDAALRNNIVYGGGSDGGGGLFATGGAQVELVGAHFVFLGDPVSSRPIRIHENLAQATYSDGTSSGAGSAVLASGSGTRVRLDRAWVYANVAGRGTFMARGGAEITVERGHEVCHSPRQCSRVFANTARLNAAAFAHSNGIIRFKRTIISDNKRSPSPSVAGLFEGQFGGQIMIDDSLIFGNSADVGLMALGDSPFVRVRRSTFSANTFDSYVMWVSDESSVSILDSIIYEPGTVMARIAGDPSFALDCIVWHADQLGGNRTLVADPQFVDPDHGLFYLKSDSPAINYCTVAPPAPGVDLDWNPRGLCHSTDEPCGAAVFDLGAYEYPLKIFSDRFEAAP